MPALPGRLRSVDLQHGVEALRIAQGIGNASDGIGGDEVAIELGPGWSREVVLVEHAVRAAGDGVEAECELAARSGEGVDDWRRRACDWNEGRPNRDDETGAVRARRRAVVDDVQLDHVI